MKRKKKKKKKKEERRKKMTTTKMMLESSGYDRAIAIKAFDDSKIGVKGLADAGATTIPQFFIHPPESLSNKDITTLSNSSSKEIPLIDLAGVDSDRRSEIMEQIRQASHSWGFFQVTNHGIPSAILDDSIAAVKSFHNQPASWKAEFYTRDIARRFSFTPGYDLFHSNAGGWRDSLKVQLGSSGVDPEGVPVICREEIFAWDVHITGLVATLMGLLSEGLGVGQGVLKEMTCLENRTLLGHYYPHCPQAELTLGIRSHSDPVILTVLLQDLPGLQVKHDGEWVDVKPLPGALVVNIGDLLQIISNGEYQSVDHRVLANGSKEPRISLAMFFNPSKIGEDDYYGPLPELLSSKKPPFYRNFTIPEYNGWFRTKDMDGKTCIDKVRL